MLTPKNEETDKNEGLTFNFSGDGFIFKELCLKCRALDKEKTELLRIKRDLMILNEKNDHISKRLLIIKNDAELYKSNLCKTLFNLKLSTDKQKILSGRNLDEFWKKAKNFQEYHKVSGRNFELEELQKKNRFLQDEWENTTELFKLTKGQYNELMDAVIQTFQKKVCEFSSVILRIQALNN